MTPFTYQPPQPPPAKVQKNAQKTAPKPFLTFAQVLEKGKNIPVFVLTNAAGSPLTAQSPEKKLVVGIFLDKDEADAFLKQLVANKHPLASTLLVTTVQLSDMIGMMQKNPTMQFTFIASEQSIKDAKALYVAAGKKPELLQGSPIFLARLDTPSGSPPSYLTVRIGGKEQTPLFFAKKDADALIRSYQAQFPGKKARMDVGTLENTLTLLQTSPDSAMQKLIFVPSAEMLAAMSKPTEPATKPPL
jgi:hypothetical protein